MHKNFLRGLSRGPLDPSAKTWPGLAELTLLRMVGMVWSTSDLSHPVTAAAQLLIGEYLAQARVRNLADLASGLFLCTLASQYERDSKRLFPESINFILCSLLLLLPTTVTSKSFPGNFPTPDFQQDHAKSLKLRSAAKGDKAKVGLSERMNLIEAVKEGKSVDGDKAEQLKANLVKTALALLSDSREKYSASQAFVELFQPAETVLKAVKLQKVPSSIKVSSSIVAIYYRSSSLICLSGNRTRSPQQSRLFRNLSLSPCNLANLSLFSITVPSPSQPISPNSTRASTRTAVSTPTPSVLLPASSRLSTRRRRREQYESSGRTTGSWLSKRRSERRRTMSHTRKRYVEQDQRDPDSLLLIRFLRSRTDYEDHGKSTRRTSRGESFRSRKGTSFPFASSASSIQLIPFDLLQSRGKRRDKARRG